MNYLHFEVDLGADDVVEVTLEHPANVLLMDDANYRNYAAGRTYRYHGGHVTESSVGIRSPGPGHWNVVVDLGGYPGTLRASVGVLKPSTST
jgi:hypothetical protein